MVYTNLVRSKKVKVKFELEVIKMTISDIIEQFIKESLSDMGGTVELRRNELAGKLKCVPSQINYVIQTRFTNERGYTVESRRGGGGCIVIRQVEIPRDNMVMHAVNSIGDQVDYNSAVAIIGNLLGYNIITKREAQIILAAVSDRILGESRRSADVLRASILKNMMLHLI